MIPPKFENCSGIYSISNNLNEKVYVGRASNFLNRYKQHLRNMKRGGINYKFASLIKENPDIRLMFNLVELTGNLKEREELYIKQLDSVENGYNVLYTDSDFIQLRSSFRRFRPQKPKKSKTKKDKMLKAYEEFESYMINLIRQKGIK